MINSLDKIFVEDIEQFSRSYFDYIKEIFDKKLEKLFDQHFEKWLDSKLPTYLEKYFNKK